MQVRNSPFGKSLLNKIARVSTSLEREVEKELKVSFGLTFSQFRVLNSMLGEGDLSQRRLAALLDVTPAVVTRQADVLARRGLIEQQPNPQSKRENVLRISPKGEEAVHDAAQVIADCQKRLFEGLSLRDETALARAIDALLG